MRRLLLTLSGLWLAAVLIRGLYALVVPPFEAPDETSHYLYALHVARGWGLPPLVQRPGEPSVGWEAGQPPLTYLMVAPLVALAAPQTEEAWVPHPAGALAQPHSVGNKNMVAHIDGRYPTATHERALVAARLALALVTALVAPLSFLLAREVVPARPAAWVLSGALAATVPQWAFIGGALNNDGVVAVAAGGLVTLSARALGRRFDWPRAALLGGVLGAAALAKASALALAPVAAAAALLGSPAAARRWQVVGMLGIAAAVAGWWYVRAWVVVGDPIASGVFVRYLERRPPGFGPLDLLAEIETVGQSSWGLFGWLNVPAPTWSYQLAMALLLLALVGLVRGLVQWREARRAVAALVGASVLLVVIAWAYWSLQMPASHGRLLAAALVPAAALGGYGLVSLAPGRSAAVLAIALSATLAAHAVALAWGTIAPAYPRVSVWNGEIPEDMRPHQIVFAPGMALVASRLQPEAQRGSALEAAFLWDASRLVDGDYRLFIEVWREAEGLAARLETWPGSGAAPTRAWRPAMRFVDVYHVPLPATLLPGRYDVTIGFLDSAGAPVQTRSGSGHVGIGSIQVLP